MSPYFKGILIGMCGAILIVWHQFSNAWDIDFSAGVMSYQESSASPAGTLEVRGSVDSLPGYVVLSYETPSIQMIGQSLGDAKIATAGIGFNFQQTHSLSWFTEIGYASVIDWESDYGVQQEVIFTELVKKHYVHNHPIPLQLTDFYDQDSYRTSYSLGGGPFGRVGVHWDITEHINARLSYRYLMVDESYDMWDEELRARGRGWWQDRTNLDLSAWSFTIGANF